MTDFSERLKIADLSHGLFVTYRCPDGTLLTGRIDVRFMADADPDSSISLDYMPGVFFMGVPKEITEKMQ